MVSKLFSSAPTKSKLFSNDEKIQQSTLDKFSNSWPVNATLGVGDALRDLLSLGYTKNSPSSSGKVYQGGKIAGDVLGFIGGGEALEALPIARTIAQGLGNTGIGGLGKRLIGSSLFGAAQEPENRIKGVKEGFKGGLIGEGLAAPFRAIGALAERTNPLKFATKQAEDIRNEYKLAHKAQQEAYAPVHEKYGNDWLTVTPRKYLDFTPKENRYFTPDVNKAYKTFLESPTFNNIHNLQSQMGKDAARVSGSPSKVNTAQTLTNARETVNNKISSFLQRDPEMARQYEEGREISRERYFPFHANTMLQKISQGLIKNPTPSQLQSAITKGAQKAVRMENGIPISSIPQSHTLNTNLNKIQKRLNQADIIKVLSSIGSGLAGAHFGGIPGAAGAGVLSHYGLPIAQNPIIEALASRLGQGARGLSQQYYQH